MGRKKYKDETRDLKVDYFGKEGFRARLSGYVHSTIGLVRHPPP
jgi:hypothetical protein